MGKTFVMGDVHGSAKGLTQCLERSGFNPQHDTLIQLGDVADGWPETTEAVDILLSLPNAMFIRGNHDCWAYDWIAYSISRPIWVEQGGRATKKSYYGKPEKMLSHFTEFWDKQVDLFVDDQNRLFIHGGWDVSFELDGLTDKALFIKAALEHMPTELGSKARVCHWDRSLFESAGWAHAYGLEAIAELNLFKEVYIGHTALKADKPLCLLDKLWNMDTGAGWSGRLSIMDIETKQSWQSDLSRDLYPDHAGRM